MHPCRLLRFGILLIAATLLPNAAHAQTGEAPSPDGLWQAVDAAPLAARGLQRQIVPRSYRSLRLDAVQLEQVLRAAPDEGRVALRESDARLWLPLPEGGFGEFRIVESPIMEPALAARYPQIRTWLGQGIDDPTATLRFDLTPKGFHAQILSAHGSVYIDPYAKGDTEHYIAYRRSEAQRDERPRCEVTGEDIPEGELHLHAHDASPQVSSGANLRTYRLAMAATGEYTQYHGGTVLDGLSAIVTTMNRVNGIYEREVGVRMVLVANNDLIVYTNPATDPYANTSGDLNANQTNLTNVIGGANYDIGHLVGTGGGGVASLRSVCVASNKARGLTGSSNPIADPFDVDYVAHEIGHQFGGNHTFNGSGGSCSGLNRNGATAYEPGSGITIQAYAGICGADNLQPNSEDYFHRVSLNEIIAFTTNPATGGSCGTLTPTGNGVPTVSAPASFTIPRQTPFELSASGSDPDGDALTYLWEQFDLGAANTAGSLVDDGSRPLFRSFRPQASPSRVFPSWRYILNNANVAPASAPLPGTANPNYFTAELLPSTNRTMNFRVTVRDNRAGGGGTNEANTAVVVTTAAGPFRVTAPNTAAAWTAGSDHSVTWNVANTTAPPVSTANVRIRLSLDGGHTWPVTLAESLPNSGAATVTVPADTPSTSRARVRVEAVGNIYFDVSDVDFSIGGGNAPPTIAVTGSLSTRQGSPTASATVASVSDLQDPAGALMLALEAVPAGLQASVENLGGSVRLSASAACEVVAPRNGTKVYPVLLRATDLDGASTAAFVNIQVAANQVPTLGSYAALSLARGIAVEHVPSQLAADANGNLVEVQVSPDVLPGGGTLGAGLDGRLQVQTAASSVPGTYPIEVTARDSCGAVETRRFNLTVEPEVRAVQLIESGGGTAVAEGGAADGYAIVLLGPPSGDVLITLDPGDQLQVSPAALVFTTGNWDVPQPVDVSAIDDRVVEGPHAGSIAHSASGGGYDASAIADLHVAIADNDAASYRFALAAASASEGQGSVPVEVLLDFATQGSGPEALAQTLSVPLVVGPASTAEEGVDFSLSSAWLEIATDGSLQPLAVLLVDDAVAEGDERLLLELGALAAGPLQAVVLAGEPAALALDILDDDVAGVVMTVPGGAIALAEGGPAGSYTLVLTSEPTAAVLIELDPGEQLTVEPQSLVFGPGDWNQARTIQVTAVDDTLLEGPHEGRVSHAISGGGYDGIFIPDAVASIEDNDVLVDIAVDLQATPRGVLPGATVAFELTVANLGPSDVPVVDLVFEIAPALHALRWTCTPVAGAVCPPAGTDLLQHPIALAGGSAALYEILAAVPDDAPAGAMWLASAVALAAPPSIDSSPGNDSADLLIQRLPDALFGDGFESD